MPSTISDVLANDAVAAVIAQFPAGSLLEFYSGAAPAITAAPTGTLLWSLALPASPWGAVSGRSVSKNGTWSANASAAGTIGWYRLRDAAATDPNAADNTHRRIQGSVTATGGGGDMTVDNTNVAIGQTVTVTNYTISA